MTNKFSNTESHKRAVRSLYRLLFRQTIKLSRASLPDISTSNKSIGQELEKQKLDPTNYVKFLSFELNYIIKEEFRSWNKVNDKNSLKFLGNFVLGTQVSSYLQGAISNNEDAWIGLLETIISHRASKFQQQIWRADYLENKSDYDQQRNSHKSSLELKQMASKMKPTDPLKYFKNLSYSDKQKRIKRELGKSSFNAQKILRRYLKKCQQNNTLPIPHLLPYTRVEIQTKAEDTAKSSLTVPGSTKTSSIEQAYDLEYIESIIKPGLEYDINKYHYIDQLRDIIMNKGPFKVQINLTEAGPMSVPFIRLPYPRFNQFKEIALDIKRSMRLIRLNTVWNADPNNISISEPRFSDGSFSVRGSKGFGEDRIHPRFYYEQLAVEEGYWEYLIEKELKKSTAISKMNRFEKKHLESLIGEWTDHLNVSSDLLDNRLNSYFQKYRILKSSNSPLLKEQKQLQLKMNSHFDNQLKKYNELIEIIDDKNIFKHSEIVNSDLQTKTYSKYLYEDDFKLKDKDRKGIPELERLGMGKKLGDYLDGIGYHYLKIGQNFEKRFKF